MAAETGFLIDGTIYEVPSLDSLTMDEEQVMFDRCGVVQEDFVLRADESEDDYAVREDELMRRPGFWASLMLIAYQRGNPTVKPDQVRLVVGNTNRLDALSTLGAIEEEEPEVPLASTSEPNESSENGSLDNDSSTRLSPVSSGIAAATGSDQEDDPAGSSGTTRSDTSSTSAHAISAA